MPYNPISATDMG
ncbi:hypothetical protein F383_30935 [Gossypium arboreum]|uniref:Uncharacterized protein n=1 Tax=Gossypium arboreum TaxID=29729 RepID=A0A0B0MZ92_GOSAR|nr:hypothetical protein F383_30935 [Gossypium arboreum]